MADQGDELHSTPKEMPSQAESVSEYKSLASSQKILDDFYRKANGAGSFTRMREFIKEEEAISADKQQRLDDISKTIDTYRKLAGALKDKNSQEATQYNDAIERMIASQSADKAKYDDHRKLISNANKAIETTITKYVGVTDKPVDILTPETPRNKPLAGTVEAGVRK